MYFDKYFAIELASKLFDSIRTALSAPIAKAFLNIGSFLLAPTFKTLISAPVFSLIKINARN